MSMPYGAAGQFPYAPQNPPPANNAPGWGGQFPTPQPGQPGYGPPQQPPQQFGPPPQQPGPQYGYPQQPQPPAPPQYGQPQTGIDLNARIAPGDTRFPQEMWGKPLSEGLRYYNIMREDFVRRNPIGGQQPQPQQQQYGQPPAPQGGYPSPVNAQPVPGGRPADPVRRMVTEAMQEVLPQYLAPLAAPLQQQAQAAAYQRVSSRFPDWRQHDAAIQEIASRATPEMLSQDALWENAYFLAKGRAHSQPQGQGGYQQQFGQPGYQGTQQPQMPQQNFGYPQPGPGQYFAEGPTPPAPMPQGNSGADDPQDEFWANKFGLPVHLYRAAKGQKGSTRWPEPPDFAAMGRQAARQQQPQPYAVNNGGNGYGV